MEFTASAETSNPAGSAVLACHRAIVPYLTSSLEHSSLVKLECTLRYVPIVMPTDALSRYPSRSRLRRRERIYDCAPQLDFEVFVGGNFEQQLDEYIAGIRTAAPHLAELGASKEQIAEFEQILSHAIEHVMANRPDQTRH